MLFLGLITALFLVMWFTLRDLAIVVLVVKCQQLIKFFIHIRLEASLPHCDVSFHPHVLEEVIVAEFVVRAA